MAFAKGNKTGNRFNSENQPKKNGRKPSMYKQLKELTGRNVAYELSKEDYFKTIRFLMEQSKPTLDAILKDTRENPDTKTPIWVCNIITAIMTDTRCGRTITVDSMFDRLFGRAIQQIEAEIKEPAVKNVLTEEQIKTELDKIDNALK
jgi:hypothetical protein